MNLTSALRCASLAMLLGACGVPQSDAVQQARQPLNNVTTVFDFETGDQGWINNGDACPNTQCFTQAVGQGSGQTELGPVFEGQGALKYHLANATTGYFEAAHYPSGDSAHENIQLGGAGSNGTVVNLAIWLPKGSTAHIGAVQAFVKTGPKDSHQTYNKQYVGNYALVEDAWTLFGVYIPPKTGVDAPVDAVGFAFSMNDTTMNDDIYIDSVSYFTP